MLVAALVACVSSPSWTDGAQAIQRDASVIGVPEAGIAGLRDTEWPGWAAIRIDPIVGFTPEVQSAMGFQDGQVLLGGFEPIGEELWWRHATMGAIRLDLERVAWIGPTSLADAPTSARDEVQFVNGDRAEGFVQSIDTRRGVRVELLAGAGRNESSTQDHDLSRVAAIRLAARPEISRGWRFWLRDGSVIDADQWARDGEKVTLQGCHLPGIAPSVALPWSQVAAIRGPAGGPVPLASVEWKSSDVQESPRLTPARTRIGSPLRALGLATIDLHGPGQFEATLPPGDWILNGAVTTPPNLQGQVDCTVVALDGEREILRHRISGDAMPVPLQGTVKSGRLRLRIEDSRRGAFGAAVRLQDAFLVQGINASPTATPQTANEGVATPSAKHPR
jgi:hypothetical protein